MTVTACELCRPCFWTVPRFLVQRKPIRMDAFLIKKLFNVASIYEGYLVWNIYDLFPERRNRTNRRHVDASERLSLT